MLHSWEHDWYGLKFAQKCVVDEPEAHIWPIPRIERVHIAVTHRALTNQEVVVQTPNFVREYGWTSSSFTTP